MSNEQVYHLGLSTVAEPLVNRWVAWSHVLAPVAGSLHLQHYQLRLMQSYLDYPQTHVEMCKNPKLRSGPFMDIPAERAGEVSALMASTKVKQKLNLNLAESLREFHNYLIKEATGQSLEPFYKELPSPLRGYVELVYDYYNHPSVKFFESLLYESPYYNKYLQSLRLFRQIDEGVRPFIMSTPRLPQSEQIEWAVPFDSPQVDEFFKLDLVPQPLAYIREILKLNEADDALLLSLLSDRSRESYRSWDASEVRLRYFGHACVLVEWNGISVLTDPYIGMMPGEKDVDCFTYADLPDKLNYVLITHNHHDHFCLETLLRLRHRIGCLVVPRNSGIFYGDLSLKLLAQKIGFTNVVELDALESIILPSGEIIAIPFMGEHADLPHSKTGYIVRAGNEQILFAADSNCLDRRMYEHVQRILGPLETVFLGMECVGAPLSWSGGAFLGIKPEPSHEQSRRYNGCDAARGLELLEAVGARRVFNYAMGLEPWLEHLLGLAYTEDSIQLKESGELLSQARQKGFLEAKLLYGKFEFILANKSRRPVAASQNHELAATEASEDQFKF